MEVRKTVAMIQSTAVTVPIVAEQMRVNQILNSNLILTKDYYLLCSPRQTKILAFHGSVKCLSLCKQKSLDSQ